MILIILVGIIIIGTKFIFNNDVYCKDFEVAECPKEWKVSKKRFIESLKNVKEDTVEFYKRLIEKTEIGEETSIPPSFLENKNCIETSRKEFGELMYPCIDKLLKRNNLKPEDIDILVVNCSFFYPMPSVSSMIINHYKMREDILSYNLSAMACSASLISLDLVNRIIKGSNKKIALIVSCDHLSENRYLGDDKSMVIQNALFREGGSAMLITNYNNNCLMKLETLKRVHGASLNDETYRLIYDKTDDKGIKSLSLSKNIVSLSGEIVIRSLKKLTSYFYVLFQQNSYIKYDGHKYIDFKCYVNHFNIHVGGKAILNTMQKILDLTDEHMKPSKTVLYEKGNVLTSSIWYQLDYLRKNKKLKKNEKVLQVAFGAGFKSVCCIWKILRSNRESCS
jgi:3-ketoacyl-CoA synthase